jgi:hypothetical protein
METRPGLQMPEDPGDVPPGSVTPGGNAGAAGGWDQGGSRGPPVVHIYHYPKRRLRFCKTSGTWSYHQSVSYETYSLKKRWYSQAEQAEMARRAAAGTPRVEIAAAFGLKLSRLYRILSRCRQIPDVRTTVVPPVGVHPALSDAEVEDVLAALDCQG